MSSSASVRSAWGLVLVCGFFMFFLGLYLGHLSVSKPRATGSCMCGIGRKRCSSRPSHDTWACRSCSQVSWSILLCCHLWVALVLSWCPWCRGEQDYHRICYVCRGLPLLRVAVCLSRVNYPTGNHELRRLLDRSDYDNLWVL